MHMPMTFDMSGRSQADAFAAAITKHGIPAKVTPMAGDNDEWRVTTDSRAIVHADELCALPPFPAKGGR